MPEPIVELASRMFVGPVWPASVLVCLLVVYTLFALIGLIDLGMDLPEIDVDPGLDVDVPGVEVPGVEVPGVDMPDATAVDVDFLQGLGAASVRATNFGRIPVVLWGGVFAMAFWCISYGLWHTYDSQRYAADWLPSVLLSVRNFVIAMVVTKAATQPMLGWFVPPPSYGHTNLLGATCEICTSEATPEFGQAKFRTNASPLLLNVRTDGPHIPKGTEVRIVDFDKEKRIYTVTHLPSETPS